MSMAIRVIIKPRIAKPLKYLLEIPIAANNIDNNISTILKSIGVNQRIIDNKKERTENIGEFVFSVLLVSVIESWVRLELGFAGTEPGEGFGVGEGIILTFAFKELKLSLDPFGYTILWIFFFAVK